VEVAASTGLDDLDGALVVLAERGGRNGLLGEAGLLGSLQKDKSNNIIASKLYNHTEVVRASLPFLDTISTVLELARPEYLKELAAIKLPGSHENITAPARAVLSRLCRKAFCFLTTIHTKESETRDIIA
jgi:hypothetical protein